MKKFALVALMAIAVSGFAFATDPVTSNNTLITANLASVLEIKSITSGTTFDLNTSGNTAQSIGTVAFNTNRRNWKVTVSSANSGKLSATNNDSTYVIPYFFSMSNSNLGDLFSGVSLSVEKIATVAKRTTLGSTTGDVAAMTINYGAEANDSTAQWVAGFSYTDTITVSVAAL